MNGQQLKPSQCDFEGKGALESTLPHTVHTVAHRCAEKWVQNSLIPMVLFIQVQSAT